MLATVIQNIQKNTEKGKQLYVPNKVGDVGWEWKIEYKSNYFNREFEVMLILHYSF